MQFHSLHDFFHMGGYAFYVWLAYGITAASIAVLVISSVRQKKKILLEIAKKMKREERLKESRSTKQ